MAKTVRYDPTCNERWPCIGKCQERRVNGKKWNNTYTDDE
jgi:hypothetical protein